MTKHEQLYEDYENALFALLMANVAEEEGRKLLEENERLKNDPIAAVPETLDRRCHETIKRSFTKKRSQAPFRAVQKVVGRVAICILAAIILFSVAYAIFPEVRTKTLNLLIEVSDIATTLRISDDNAENVVVRYEVFGYNIAAVPEMFTKLAEGSDSRTTWVKYGNAEGAEIHISIGGSSSMKLNVDTEDADSVEKITIFEYDGLLIEKENRVHIVWGDTEQEVFVSIEGINSDKNFVMDIVNNMK